MGAPRSVSRPNPDFSQVGSKLKLYGLWDALWAAPGEVLQPSVLLPAGAAQSPRSPMAISLDLHSH